MPEETRTLGTTEHLAGQTEPGLQGSLEGADPKEDLVPSQSKDLSSRQSEPVSELPACAPPAIGFLSNSNQNVPAHEALREARKYVRLHYWSSLLYLLLIVAVIVVSTAVLVASLLLDGSLLLQSTSGTIAIIALLLFILLQYRPSEGFARASTELALLEALEAHLEKSYSLWDGFFQERENRRELSANDIALAVSSMTSATQNVIALQSNLLESRRRSGRGAQSPPQPTFPSPTSPDPRRY